MLSAYQRDLIQRIMILFGLALGLYYLLVYRALSSNAQKLDKPLIDVWQQLAKTNLQPKSVLRFDLRTVREDVQRVQSAVAMLENANKTVSSRLSIPADLVTNLCAPFRLVEFNNQRQRLIEAITRAAGAASVTIAPAVTAHFPEFTTQTAHPALLWAQLYFVQHTLLSAIQCRIAHIVGLDLALPPNNASPAQFQEISFGVEIVGPAASVLNFLMTLPMRASETANVGLSLPGHKPPLFIDNLMLRKQNSAQLDEVHLLVKLTGFCPGPGSEQLFPLP